MEISISSSSKQSVEYKLPLGEAAATFELAKAVCSHGFFMTAPNHWDPLSQTLRRPLRLDQNDGVSSSSSSSVIVEVSQPPQSSHLILRVFDTDSLSPAHQQQLMDQVRRMLRLSEMEERNVREFHQMYAEAKASGFGRMFRSPTLFEDMVKCILVCNCQLALSSFPINLYNIVRLYEKVFASIGILLNTPKGSYGQMVDYINSIWSKIYG